MTPKEQMERVGIILPVRRDGECILDDRGILVCVVPNHEGRNATAYIRRANALVAKLNAAEDAA